MNVLLVSPRFPESYWSFSRALKIIKRKSLLPPLGLLTVAAMLPAAWKKRLVDTNVQNLTDGDLAWADYVFIGGMGIQWNGAKEVVARAKAAGKKIVAGGPLFTAAYAFFQDVDHFVLNEAELTLPGFLADLEKGSPKRIYRSKDFANMHETPAPLWELADLSKYAVMSIQYTRGCPFDCDFCNVTAMLGRKPRFKTPAQIINELDGLYAAGWRERIFFVDDNLIGNRKVAREELLPALVEWQKTHGPTAFCTQASINLADDQNLTQGMVDAGFDTIFVGIETSDPKSLEECSKVQNRNRDLIRDVKKLQRAGLEVQAGFIVGFDHDTLETFGQQMDFIQASGIVSAMVGQLQAPPGTQLHARMAKEGRLLGISLGDNTDGSTNILPKMGVEPLRRGHAWLLKNIYAPKPYYQRLKTLLEEITPPKVHGRLGWKDFLPCWRAIVAYGIAGAERAEFWKLLLWTLVHKRGALPLMVRLAAIGHHHRCMSEELVANLSKAAPAIMTPQCAQTWSVAAAR